MKTSRKGKALSSNQKKSPLQVFQYFMVIAIVFAREAIIDNSHIPARGVLPYL